MKSRSYVSKILHIPSYSSVPGFSLCVRVLDENLYKLIYAEKIIHLLEFST